MAWHGMGVCLISPHGYLFHPSIHQSIHLSISASMNRIPGPLRERPLPSPLAPSKLEPRNYMYMYVCIRVFVWFVLFVLFWLFRLSRYLDIFRYSYATLCYARLLYATPVTAKTHIHTYTHTYTHMHTHSSILSFILSFIHSFIHTSSIRLLNPPSSPPSPPQQITVSFLSHPLLTPSPGPDSEHSLSPDGTGLVFGDFVRFLV